MKYELKKLNRTDHDVIKMFYEWKTHENHFDYYTCRPVKDLESYEIYKENMNQTFDKGNRTYYLTDDDDVLGKVSLFDYNIRNKSAEFGYYFPENMRGKGYGSILLNMFVDEVFNDTELSLNKLYATTSSNNVASIKMLEKHGFKLDGVMREHYWIDGNKYDQNYYSKLRSEWLKEDK